MAVVTISREYGSAGSAVAREAASLLGYRLVNKASLGNILASYGLIDFDKAYEAESGIWSAFDTRLRTIVSMLDRVALSVARQGNAVMLGRGCYIALAGRDDVLNVRLRAPFEWRVSRIMQEQGIADRGSVEAEVREGDKVRSSFVSSVYGLRWDSMEKFDLVIDISKIGPSRAAAWIIEAAKALPPAKSREGVDKADTVLDEAVAAEYAKGNLA